MFHSRSEPALLYLDNQETSLTHGGYINNIKILYRILVYIVNCIYSDMYCLSFVDTTTRSCQTNTSSNLTHGGP